MQIKGLLIEIHMLYCVRAGKTGTCKVYVVLQQWWTFLKVQILANQSQMFFF